MRLIAFAILLAGCQDLYSAKRPYEVREESREYFSDLNEKILINKEYPIEVQLRKDGTFWYKLNKLGEGEGTWLYEEGHAKLYAERKLFVMKLDIRAAESGPVIEFSDRFGPKFLKIE